MVSAMILVALAACANPPPMATSVPSATPTLVATATFRPAVPPATTPVAFGIPAGAQVQSQPQAQATVDPSAADPADVEDAFLSNVDELIAQASELAAASCDELNASNARYPSPIGSMLGFAATLKRTAASQTLLDTDAVKLALADLDRAVGELRGALNLCGISPT